MQKNDLKFTPHQLKAIESDNHLALIANAGSGKTTVLKYKFLNLAIKLNGDISKIAAITFTNKAASELYKKISELIDIQLASTKDSNRKLILYKIRRRLVSAHISTIHSFCIDLLKNYPVEAGIDANFVPINQSTSNEILELSIEEVINKLFIENESSEIIKDLIRYFGSRSKLEAEVKKLFAKRKNILIISKNLYSKSTSDIANYFTELFIKLTENIKNIYCVEFVTLLEKINSIALNSIKKKDTAKKIKNIIDNFKVDEDFVSLLKNVFDIAFTGDGTLKKKGYLSSELQVKYFNDVQRIEQLHNKLKKFVSDLNLDFSKHIELAEFGKKILFLFDTISNQYEKKKQSNSFLDFDDLLIKTRILLQNPEVKRELSKKFKYLMVDEYQDTDEIQYEIFLPLLNDLKDGNLFIVGDEKQSIYRFRDADLNVFEKTKTDIVQHNQLSGIQILPDSFRMVKELCLFTNYIFNRIFDKEIPLFNELKNEPIICAKEDNNEIGEIEFLVSTKDNNETQSQSELVALKILEIIKNTNYTFSQISVLVTKRKYFDEIERTFTKMRIPYKIYGGRGFFQRQVTNDIRNYLSFLANPYDNTALLSILRSPFFLLSDTEIFKINLSNGKTFFEKLKNHSSSNKNYSHIVSKLEEQIKLSSSLPTSILIRKILSESEFLIIIKNRHDGEQELANIEKLINIAREFDKNGFKTLYDFVKYLDDAVLTNIDEATAEGELSESGVQLMTIHQAKGLEFPIVFLYRCEAAPESITTKEKEIVVDKDFGILAYLQQDNDSFADMIKPPILTAYDFIEQQKAAAELKRLFYVAVTRAINKLFISYEENENQNYKNLSFIYLLKNILPLKSNSTLTIKDNLKFLKKNDSGFYNIEKEVNIEIKIIDNTNKEKINPIDFTIADEKKYILNTQKLNAENDSQIISATKIVTYNNCPLKYHLTYNLGLAKLFNIAPEFKTNLIDQSISLNELESQNMEELVSDETIVNLNTQFDLFGRLIHKILEKEITKEKLDLFLDKKTSEFSIIKTKSDKFKISKLLNSYYDSEIYKKLSSYKNFENEMKIAIKEDNLILMGIIDKIIFNDDEIIIVDYKTDAIEPSNLNFQFSNYQIQMKFYLYISMKSFENFNKFLAKLIFLRDTNLEFELKYDRSQLSSLKMEIFSLINGIREKRTEKQLNHCNQCIYSFKNDHCIIQ